MKNAVEIVYILVQKGPTWLTLCVQAKDGRSQRIKYNTLTRLLTLRFKCQVVKEVISPPVEGF